MVGLFAVGAAMRMVEWVLDHVLGGGLAKGTGLRAMEVLSAGEAAGNVILHLFKVGSSLTVWVQGLFGWLRMRGKCLLRGASKERSNIA